ncbi:MAG: hypothetical protein AMS21_00840 [Gemmatimonas sp. SG8_38_2]|nr:MAG: hypothetical protein AMS21_00840 [Gemmatimonas sp. SG8_38_2]
MAKKRRCSIMQGLTYQKLMNAALWAFRAALDEHECRSHGNPSACARLAETEPQAKRFVEEFNKALDDMAVTCGIEELTKERPLPKKKKRKRK